MTNLSIVIVNYKTWPSLSLCLDSIKKQENILINVIVVDNNSGDHQISDFKIRYDWVKWIESSENLGFAKACNLGASKSNSDWILFLNPDTILDKNSLKPLLNFCEKNLSYRIIGIKQLNDNFQNTNSFGFFLSFWALTGPSRAVLRLFRGSNSYFNKNEITFPDWISGSFILLRHADYDLLNGWDEDFWMYYEDMDLCKRAKNLGLQVTLINKWKCIHSHGKASRKSDKIKIRSKSEVIVSSHIYLEKHFNKYVKYSTHLLLIIFQAFELIIKSIFSKNYRDILNNVSRFWLRGVFKNIWKSKMALN